MATLHRCMLWPRGGIYVDEVPLFPSRKMQYDLMFLVAKWCIVLQLWSTCYRFFHFLMLYLQISINFVFVPNFKVNLHKCLSIIWNENWGDPRKGWDSHFEYQGVNMQGHTFNFQDSMMVKNKLRSDRISQDWKRYTRINRNFNLPVAFVGYR